jgi:hypothetical protein
VTGFDYQPERGVFSEWLLRVSGYHDDVLNGQLDLVPPRGLVELESEMREWEHEYAVGERDAAQPDQLIRALCDVRDDMIRHLRWLEDSQLESVSVVQAGRIRFLRVDLIMESTAISASRSGSLARSASLPDIARLISAMR